MSCYPDDFVTDDGEYIEYDSPKSGAIAIERYHYSLNKFTVDIAIYSDNTVFIQMHDGDETRCYYSFKLDNESNILGNFNLRKGEYSIDSETYSYYYIEEEYSLVNTVTGW